MQKGAAPSLKEPLRRMRARGNEMRVLRGGEEAPVARIKEGRECRYIVVKRIARGRRNLSRGMELLAEREGRTLGSEAEGGREKRCSNDKEPLNTSSI